MSLIRTMGGIAAPASPGPSVSYGDSMSDSANFEQLFGRTALGFGSYTGGWVWTGMDNNGVTLSGPNENALQIRDKGAPYRQIQGNEPLVHIVFCPNNLGADHWWEVPVAVAWVGVNNIGGAFAINQPSNSAYLWEGRGSGVRVLRWDAGAISVLHEFPMTFVIHDIIRFEWTNGDTIKVIKNGGEQELTHVDPSPIAAPGNKCGFWAGNAGGDTRFGGEVRFGSL